MNGTASNDKDHVYIHWFNQINGLRKSTILSLIRTAGSAEVAYHMKSREMKEFVPAITSKEMEALETAKRRTEPDEVYDRIARNGISLVTLLDPDYPERLRPVYNPPLCLYYYGTLPDDSRPAVAIVGARACSNYGEKIAAEYGKQLAENGIQVISGMAMGIDSISQAACVEAGGYSAGILGSGCDICYPRESRKLYDRLKTDGALISENIPGTQPLRQYFPARNRIISGLSQAVLLVEARERSGSLITADIALEQGREVYAVPGRVNESLSSGCNRLIKQGAGMALTPREFIEDLFDENYIQEIKRDRTERSKKALLEIRKPVNLDDGESIIWDALSLDPRPIDQIHRDISDKIIISIPELMQVLLRMCIKGAARQVAATYFTK